MARTAGDVTPRRETRREEKSVTCNSPDQWSSLSNVNLLVFPHSLSVGSDLDAGGCNADSVPGFSRRVYIVLFDGF